MANMWTLCLTLLGVSVFPLAISLGNFSITSAFSRIIFWLMPLPPYLLLSRPRKDTSASGRLFMYGQNSSRSDLTSFQTNPFTPLRRCLLSLVPHLSLHGENPSSLVLLVLNLA